MNADATPPISTSVELLAVVVYLRPLALPSDSPSRETPSWWGDAARSLLLRSIGTFNPDTASDLHEENKIRPATVSSLQGRFPGRSVSTEETYRLRYTALNHTTATALLQCIQPGGPISPGMTVELDRRPFVVESTAIDPAVDLWADATTYQSLASSAMLGLVPAPDRLTFTFISPTSFSSNGRLSDNGQNIAYPLPGFVLGSLLDRWNTFAPISFPDELRLYIKECMRLTHFEIRSRAVRISSGLQIGMVGSATFRTRNYDRYWMSLIHALSRFAFFSGVGAKTSMGMGQCRYEERNEDRKDNGISTDRSS